MQAQDEEDGPQARGERLKPQPSWHVSGDSKAVEAKLLRSRSIAESEFIPRSGVSGSVKAAQGFSLGFPGLSPSFFLF